MVRAVSIALMFLVVPVMFLAAGGAVESDAGEVDSDSQPPGEDTTPVPAIPADDTEAPDSQGDNSAATDGESETEELTIEEEALRVYKISNMIAGTIFNIGGIVFVVESGSRYTTEVEPAWMRYNERTAGTADEFATAYDEYTNEYNTYLLHMFTGVGLGSLGVIFTLIGMLATEPPPGYAGEPEPPVDVSVNNQGLMVRVRY